MSDTNGTIEVGPCRCPGAIHGTDWVELHPELTLPGGLAVAAALGEGSGLKPIEIGPAALEALFQTEIRAWSFVDDRGPVPILSSTIRRMLPFARGGAVVANALTPRLQEAASTDPFTVAQTPPSSDSGPTQGTEPSEDSTSVKPRTSRKHRPR